MILLVFVVLLMEFLYFVSKPRVHRLLSKSRLNYGIVRSSFFPFYREKFNRGKIRERPIPEKNVCPTIKLSHTDAFQLFAKHGNRLLSFYLSQCWVQIIFYVISTVCRLLWKTNSRKIRESLGQKFPFYKISSNELPSGYCWI